MSEQDIVALCLGGAQNVMEEYENAVALCIANNKTWITLVCNDTIALFSQEIDKAVTLHPDKMPIWLDKRRAAGLIDPKETWCHRPYRHISNDTKDWGGSSGLLMVKIAREAGIRKVVLCGVPMTVEAGHIVRRAKWTAAHGFRRGWMRHTPELKPFVRSFAGWTKELFGEPTSEWLKADIPDPSPPRAQHEALKA